MNWVDLIDGGQPLAMLPAAGRALVESLRRGAEPRVEATTTAAATTRKADGLRKGAAGAVGSALAKANMIATIEIVGLLARRRPLVESPGMTMTAYSDIARQVGQAADDPDVAAILLRVESPGGMAYGLQEAFDAILAARAIKPVVAWIDSIAASAGYWLASGADAIVARRGALVGSIGTWLALVDSSGAAEAAGLRVIVVKAGENKAAGIFGAKVSDADVREAQRFVDEGTENFLADVARGRRRPLNAVRAWGDGSIRYAEYALSVGMIDAIGDEDAALKLIGRDSRAAALIAQRRLGLELQQRAEAAASEQRAADEAAIARFEAAVRQQPNQPWDLGDAGKAQRARAARPDLWVAYEAACNRLPVGDRRRHLFDDLLIQQATAT